ncbi:MAG: hypothetical protein OYK82_11450 [Gammaproteobacteria bacterium]|nr:hypothetical protein [Gammaproteobacteria bacterium]
MIVHQDQDPVFTGYAWTSRLLGSGVRPAYALRGPGDNPEMESFFGRTKVEIRSPVLDAESLEELKTIIGMRNQIRQSDAPSVLPRRPAAHGIIQDIYHEC